MATVDINLGRFILKPFVAMADGNVNISSAPATIGGVTLTIGDRVFLRAQTTASQNGGYVWNGTGNAMTRVDDLSEGSVIKSGTQFILQKFNDTSFHSLNTIYTTTGADITIGTTSFSVRISNSGDIEYAGFNPSTTDTQAAATELTSTLNVILLNEGDTSCVKLPLESVRHYAIVFNNRSSRLKVYPSLSGNISGVGTNLPLTMEAGEICIFYGYGNIGNGKEWATYRPVSQTITNGVTNKAPSEDAVFDAIRTEATTGAVINFTNPKVFNTPASPTTSNITDNLTGALTGVIQKIYHNHSVAPTFPAGWVKLNGNYTTSTLNIIYAEWVSGTRVEYWIVKS